MKVKCVSNIDIFGRESEYLTTGKIYEMNVCDEENDAGELIDDVGDTIFENLIMQAHGKWEVVE